MDRPAARVERVLAVGRAFLTVTGLIAIYLDPTEPARLRDVTYGVLLGYAIYSLAVLAYVNGSARVTPKHRRVLHGLDILWTSGLTFVSEGPVSFGAESVSVVVRDHETQRTLLWQLDFPSGDSPMRSRVTFRTLANEWEASVVPMYKHSTQIGRFMLKKHLLPRFGDRMICEVTRQEIQAYVAHLTQKGYAPRSIDHVHDVLSAILRTAMKWGHLQDNPARGVDLPKLKCVRPKWVLTPSQAALLLNDLSLLPRTMAGLAILSGLRRGELFALRWRDIDEQARLLTVREAVYDGVFATPKTEAGSRQIPLSDAALTLIAGWKAHVGSTEPHTLYTQVLDGSLRAAVDKVGSELFTIVHKQKEEVTVSPLTVQSQTPNGNGTSAASAPAPTPCPYL